MSQCLRHARHLDQHTVPMIPHHHEKGEYSVARCLARPDHVHVVFITVCCYNDSTSLLVIVVNLLLCLIYKLSFIISVCRKNVVYIGIGTIRGLRHPLGVWESIPRRLYTSGVSRPPSPGGAER